MNKYILVELNESAYAKDEAGVAKRTLHNVYHGTLRTADVTDMFRNDGVDGSELVEWMTDRLS